MKTKLLYLALLVNALAYAQGFHKIEAKQMTDSHYATSFTTDIVGLNEGFVIFHWQKFIENHGGTTFVEKKEQGLWQFKSEHVKFPPLNDELVTLYSRLNLDASETGVKMTIWLKRNDGSYFSSENKNDETVQKLKTWLLDFNTLLEQENKAIIAHEKSI